MTHPSPPYKGREETTHPSPPYKGREKMTHPSPPYKGREKGIALCSVRCHSDC